MPTIAHTTGSFVTANAISVGQCHQAVDSMASFDDHTATMSAVATIGTTFRHVLFTAEAYAPVTAAAAADFNGYLIDKHAIGLLVEEIDGCCSTECLV